MAGRGRSGKGNRELLLPHSTVPISHGPSNNILYGQTLGWSPQSLAYKMTGPAATSHCHGAQASDGGYANHEFAQLWYQPRGSIAQAEREDRSPYSGAGTCELLLEG